MASDKPGFLAELKRRNVLRAAVLYIGAVWALAQGISQLSSPLGLATWVTVWFLIACAIAFPFWLAFAWFYEFTPHGIKRDSDVAEDAPSRHSIARRLDFAIIGVLALAVILLASGYFVHRGDKTPATTTGATARPAGATSAAVAAAAKPFDPPAGTLAVLPFTNLNGEASQQYFSDGITEELTNALGQNTALTVIAWDTASHYRNSKATPNAIGRALNVANLLNGTIEREGNEVRVLAELVNTRTGAQVWSDHYDAALANVFQVQDRISAAIAGALKVKFADLGPAPTVNPHAHDLVLKARALMDKANTGAPFEQALKLYQQAIVFDPNYADAHAGLARAWYELTQFSTLSLNDALPKARAEADRALVLNPRNVEALVVLGNVEAAQGRVDAAKSYFERALALDPSNAVAHVEYGVVLPLKQALAQDLEAVQLDPDNAAAQNDLGTMELDLGAYARALAPFQAQLRLDPTSADNALELAAAYTLLGRNEEAVQVLDLARPDTALGKSIIAAGRLTYQSLVESALHTRAVAAVAALHARTDLDPISLSDVIQLELALGEDRLVLEQLPKWCASVPVACSDLSVNPQWLRLRGDPRFQALVKQYDTVSKPAAATSMPASAATSP